MGAEDPTEGVAARPGGGGRPRGLREVGGVRPTPRPLGVFARGGGEQGLGPCLPEAPPRPPVCVLAPKDSKTGSASEIPAKPVVSHLSRGPLPLEQLQPGSCGHLRKRGGKGLRDLLPDRETEARRQGPPSESASRRLPRVGVRVSGSATGPCGLEYHGGLEAPGEGALPVPPSGLGTPCTSLHKDYHCRGQLCPVVAKPEKAAWPC